MLNHVVLNKGEKMKKIFLFITVLSFGLMVSCAGTSGCSKSGCSKSCAKADSKTCASSCAKACCSKK